MSEEKNTDGDNSRKKFLKLGVLGGVVAAVAGSFGILDTFGKEKKPIEGKKIKLLSPDGKIIEVDSSLKIIYLLTS